VVTEELEAYVKTNGTGQRIELGQFIVADPEICHGKPAYKGTHEALLCTYFRVQGHTEMRMPRKVPSMPVRDFANWRAVGRQAYTLQKSSR
jgi:hypothetical protein